MTFEELEIPGCYTLNNLIHEDLRGSLNETWKLSEIHKIPGWGDFYPVQQNFVESSINAIRGIHRTKRNFPQSKILTVNYGIIKDVLVDLRIGSKTYGSFLEVVLDATKRQTLLISQGIGHAFQTLSAKSLVTYAFSSEYSPNNEITISPIDPDLRINWESPFYLSDKDKSAAFLKEINPSWL